MDFSLHERRRLAQIEQELSGDRRLVAMLGILESKRRRTWRVLRYAGNRARRPGHRHTAPRTVTYRFAMAALVLSCVLLLAAPALLVTALVIGLPGLTALAIALLPVPPLAVVLSGRWVRTQRRSQP